MIEVCVGNLFESGAQTLVNTVNCVGVMGRGIALQFKRRFPAMFADYRARCERGEVRMGRPYVWRASDAIQVLNFPTKAHWRDHSRLSAIVDGLEHLVGQAEGWDIRSLAVPPLGCGLGQLEWKVVGPTLFRHLSRLDLPVRLYAPHETPPEQLSLDFLAADDAEGDRIPAAWVALVAVLARIRENPHHWPIGRTTFQKLAYFVTRQGIPTGLSFERAAYGPFSREVRRMQSRLLANGLIVEQRRGRMYEVHEGPTFVDAVRRYRAQIADWGDRLRPVVNLFSRLQRTVDAELAATVHFQVGAMRAEGGQPSERDVFEAISGWKGDRIDAQSIAHAIRALGAMGWVDLKPSDSLPLPEDPLC